MLSVPEVTSTARRTGRAELDEHVQGVESAEIDVRLDDEGPAARSGARGAATEGVAAAWNQRDDWPAHFPPHRPHAVRDARQYRRQDLRRRSRSAATARATGSGRDVAGRRRRRPRHRAANRYPDTEGARGSGGGGAPGTRDWHRGGSAADRAGRTRRRPDPGRPNLLSSRRAVSRR